MLLYFGAVTDLTITIDTAHMSLTWQFAECTFACVREALETNHSVLELICHETNFTKGLAS